MHLRCDNQYKTGVDRGNIFGEPRLFECIGICVLSPAHESELRGYIVYVLIVKYLSHRFCLNSATVYKIGRPYRGIFSGIFETFLEGSVDRVIDRDYIVNRSFSIYCSLARWTDRRVNDTKQNSPRMNGRLGGGGGYSPEMNRPYMNSPKVNSQQMSSPEVNGRGRGCGWVVGGKTAQR